MNRPRTPTTVATIRLLMQGPRWLSRREQRAITQRAPRSQRSQRFTGHIRPPGIEGLVFQLMDSSGPPATSTPAEQETKKNGRLIARSSVTCRQNVAPVAHVAHVACSPVADAGKPA